MEITTDTIRDHLPYYLTEQAKTGVLRELERFHLGEMQYYLLNRYQEEMLQGDGWQRLQLRNFDTGEKIFINGTVFKHVRYNARQSTRLSNQNHIRTVNFPCGLRCNAPKSGSSTRQHRREDYRNFRATRHEFVLCTRRRRISGRTHRLVGRCSHDASYSV
jgi:hypothetical protein